MRKSKSSSITPQDAFARRNTHILPKGFRKIRHYGILASRNKPVLKEQQDKMGSLPEKTNEKENSTISKDLPDFDMTVCPCCKKGKMETVLNFKLHSPPLQINDKSKV